MQKDEAAAHLARQASEALAEMLANSPSCPIDADRFDWSSETLDELARAATVIGQIAQRYTARTTDGDEDPEGVRARATELATAIVRCRNSLVGEGAGARRVRSDAMAGHRLG